MQFYINKGVKKEGPYSPVELSQLQLTRETMVWTEGYADWLPAGDVSALSDILQNASPAHKTFGIDTGVNRENKEKESRANLGAFIWTVVIIAAVLLIVLLSKSAFGL